jgi:hypothetical protein
MVVEVPAQRDHVLGRAAPKQHPALVGVQAESDGVGHHIVEVHPDRVAAETPPVIELVGLDDDVAQVHIAEHRWL